MHMKRMVNQSFTEHANKELMAIDDGFIIKTKTL